VSGCVGKRLAYTPQLSSVQRDIGRGTSVQVGHDVLGQHLGGGGSVVVRVCCEEDITARPPRSSASYGEFAYGGLMTDHLRQVPRIVRKKEFQLARDGQRPWGDPARRPRPADLAGIVIGSGALGGFVFALIITAIELRIFGQGDAPWLRRIEAVTRN
jgi:hypothetical protein